MMENPMSKKANELLLKLLASGIDAAGAHCGGDDAPAPGGDEPDDDEPDESPDDADDKKGTTIRFF
jgi:hypothetical protein